MTRYYLERKPDKKPVLEQHVSVSGSSGVCSNKSRPEAASKFMRRSVEQGPEHTTQHPTAQSRKRARHWRFSKELNTAALTTEVDLNDT